ncbi:MAG: DUF4159 domain-containing protein [Gemmatimonadota bacterium]
MTVRARFTAGLLAAASIMLIGAALPTQDQNPGYNARFTFTRIRFNSYGGFRGGGGSWAHDYPAADMNLPTVLSEISLLRPTLGSSNVLDLEDPAIFRNPILYVSEPGFWNITEHGARNLRSFMLKGGFVIFDDFEDTGNQWSTFAASFKAAMPEYEFIEINVTHPVFQTFFELEKLDTPHPLVRVTPIYLGVFEDNDPAKRMLALINLNCDLAEYWEWSGQGFFPIDSSNDAFKMGVNYIFYGLTH